MSKNFKELSITFTADLIMRTDDDLIDQEEMLKELIEGMNNVNFDSFLASNYNLIIKDK